MKTAAQARQQWIQYRRSSPNIIRLEDYKMRTAEQARQYTIQRVPTKDNIEYVQLKRKVSVELDKALDSGQRTVCVNLPFDTNRALLLSLKNSLKRMGYQVSLGSTNGAVGEGLLHLPRVTVTLYW